MWIERGYAILEVECCPVLRAEFKAHVALGVARVRCRMVATDF